MEGRREYFKRKATFPGLDGSSYGRDLGSAASKGAGLTESGKFAEVNEKELLHGLNSRLAGFIEKVRQLERHNQLLEREIKDIRGKAQTASDLEQEYGPELRRLRQLVQDMTLQKQQIETVHQNLEEELCNIRERRENEACDRSDAERNIAALKRDVSDAYQVKVQLEKKAQSLIDEIHLLKTNHQAEVSEMTDQIQVAQESVKEFGKRDLTETLRDIRAQLEGHEALDLQQTEETFRSQFAKLTRAAETKREALRATQQEIQEYRRCLQTRNIELDCAKGTREAMEQQLHEAEERHGEEILHYQNTIKQLENELINSKFDMSAYLREYQDLVNVKMALDMEILSYRKLLCGEEARLSRVSDGHVSTPYIYHQSPVYTLPRPGWQGGAHPRGEPQYKFVEEIITETTREIEMLEYEETGSREGEGGEEEEQREQEEQEGPKSDRGGSEEDNYKDGREEEGEQECDSEQDQVGEEEGVDGGKVEEESKADDSKEKHDADAPREVQVTESDEERKDEERVESVSKDPSAKPLNSKSEVPEEEEDKKDPPKTESEPATLKDTEGLRASAQADETSAPKPQASAQTRELSDVVDETSAPEPQASAQTRELSDVVDVQRAQTLAARDLTAEQKSETAEASDSKEDGNEGVATKSEEKENGSPTPTVTGESETPKREDEEAKSIQDVTRDKDIDADLPLQSNAGGEKPNGDDKTQKVQSWSPEAKVSSSAEVKEIQQGAPQSSQIQTSEVSGGSDGSGAEKVKRVEGETAGEKTVSNEAEKKK